MEINQPNQPQILHKIEDKKNLMALYVNQLPEPLIRSEINEIITINRKLEPSTKVMAKRISLKESLMFIDRHGEPLGYTLSEDLQNKLKSIEVDN